MAGSYRHCVDERGRFQGAELLDNLGDAVEALEEMYGMIWWLADFISSSDAHEGTRSWEFVDLARQNIAWGLHSSPGKVPHGTKT